MGTVVASEQRKARTRARPNEPATTSKSARLIVSADAASRLAVADAFVRACDHGRGPRGGELVVVAASWESADDVARTAAVATGASFGLARFTLDRLAARLAERRLAAAGRVRASALSFDALVARVVHRQLADGGFRYYAPVATRPGFPIAVGRTLAELRMNAVEPAALRMQGALGEDLALLASLVEHELATAGLADRALVWREALAAVGAGEARAALGVPLLLVDLTLATALEARLIATLVGHAPAVLATAPAGDEASVRQLAGALGVEPETVGVDPGTSLAELQTHLFADTAPDATTLDDSVTLASAPGEARECVEIARLIQFEAKRGVAFDRMAILVHSPGEYAAHLEEALRRAAIPAFFTRGTRRPHPAGRAILALIACAAEGLSARRFAEYLSLAQVPEPGTVGDVEAVWSAPDDDLLAREPAPVPSEDDDDPLLRDPDAAAVVGGTLRAPWRWEELLVDAAVIGTEQRWARRLGGLGAELAARRGALRDDDPRRAALERTATDLAHLRAFALPLIRRLAAWPERATWGVWLQHLRELAAAALRHPEPVGTALAELEPMAPIGPVDLDEVALVLAPRLRELVVPPPRRRYGAVMVAPTTTARGLAFDVVFVPGLAERLFPRKVIDDPILPDARRGEICAELGTQASSVAAERLALQVAVGAARGRVHLSYPRLDVEQARPRVPSFYALEALRAAEGTLPGFDELRLRASAAAEARLGWPAPSTPAAAIDEAEYDLALLEPVIRGDAAQATGSAHYLLAANPYLARALRARARRWLPGGWTVADGLVRPPEGRDSPDRAAELLVYERARAALARHQLATRSFSATALQNFAVCPYRFLLQAVHRLQPREDAVAIEEMDPLTRGALVHEVQFAVLTRLRDDALLPVRPDGLEHAYEVAGSILDRVADTYRDRLAPAIARVWEDGIATIRADLHEWLRRQAEADDGWVPHRFELSFGIVDRERGDADPASVATPVPILGGLQLRGAIDLVERRESGMLRVTDYKTGRVWTKAGVVVGGGETLQPLLYALAAERLLAAPVESGRLYYCTADGEYTERVVRLDDAGRAAAAEVVRIVDRALQDGFLPAAPREGACNLCDYRPVCGPHEALRTSRKPPARLGELKRLRSLP